VMLLSGNVEAIGERRERRTEIEFTHHKTPPLSH
jgi:hypothetical protein